MMSDWVGIQEQKETRLIKACAKPVCQLRKVEVVVRSKRSSCCLCNLYECTKQNFSLKMIAVQRLNKVV